MGQTGITFSLMVEISKSIGNSFMVRGSKFNGEMWDKVFKQW